MRQRDTADDRGFSLIEILVTTGIMSIVMVTVLTATIQIYSGTKRIDQTSFARDQLDNSFRRLDRELRYATWMSPDLEPVGTRYYMEYELVTVDGKTPCRQVKLADGKLTLASWEVSSSTPGPPTIIAAGAAVSTAKPFTIYKPGERIPGTTGVGVLTFQQVRLRFDVKSGNTTLPFDSTFTAQNIGRDSKQDSGCKQGRPIQ